MFIVTMLFSVLQLVDMGVYSGVITGEGVAVSFAGEAELPVLQAVGSELLGEILIAIIVGIPLLLLALKVLRGDFWPGRILEQYREGKRQRGRDDNE